MWLGLLFSHVAATVPCVVYPVIFVFTSYVGNRAWFIGGSGSIHFKHNKSIVGQSFLDGVAPPCFLWCGTQTTLVVIHCWRIIHRDIRIKVPCYQYPPILHLGVSMHYMVVGLDRLEDSIFKIFFKRLCLHFLQHFRSHWWDVHIHDCDYHSISIIVCRRKIPVCVFTGCRIHQLPLFTNRYGGYPPTFFINSSVACCCYHLCLLQNKLFTRIISMQMSFLQAYKTLR